jgi:hypothetical protein
LITSLSGYNLGTEALLGAIWGQKTGMVKIEREMMHDTWQHVSKPSQQRGATCHLVIGPRQLKWVPHGRI